MLNIKALRGLNHPQLIIDDHGMLPLPGDKPEDFWLGGYEYLACMDSEKKKEIFQFWCKQNAIILGRAMRLLFRWKDSLNQLQDECRQEKENFQATFNTKEFLMSLKEEKEVL